MARKNPREVDGPEWLEAYRNGPKGVWLIAGGARGEEVPIDQTYPHVHGLEIPGAKPVDGRIPTYARRECAACAGADAPVKPRVLSVPDDSGRSTARTEVNWRWACLFCGANGEADSEANAHGLTNLHMIAACPATAWNEEEFNLRMLRRQTVARLYPDEVPAYTKPYSGTKKRPTTS